MSKTVIFVATLIVVILVLAYRADQNKKRDVIACLEKKTPKKTQPQPLEPNALDHGHGPNGEALIDNDETQPDMPAAVDHPHLTHPKALPPHMPDVPSSEEPERESYHTAPFNVYDGNVTKNSVFINATPIGQIRGVRSIGNCVDSCSNDTHDCSAISITKDGTCSMYARNDKDTFDQGVMKGVDSWVLRRGGHFP
jgi:hypothetical protein